MAQMPPGYGPPPWYGPPPPEPRIHRWLPWVIVSIVVVLICGTVGGALLLVRLNGGFNFSPPLAPQLPAAMGQPLVINGVTVTLTSATVTQETAIFGGAYQIAHIWLHCSNQMNYDQSVPMSGWRLYIDGGTTQYYPLIRGLSDQNECALAPNQTADLQFDVDMQANDTGPYTLDSDFTTSQGTPLGWTFSP